MSKLSRAKLSRSVAYKFRYAVGDSTERWVAIASRTEPRPWLIPLSYPTARISEGGFRIIPWSADRLREALLPVIEKLKKAYGGDWTLKICANTAGMDQDAERRHVSLPTMKGVENAYRKNPYIDLCRPPADSGVHQEHEPGNGEATTLFGPE